jgi:hypothetical protein
MDLTPNEKRIIYWDSIVSKQTPVEEELIFYPFNDQYPDGKEIRQFFNDERLIKAIQFLQTKRISSLLKEDNSLADKKFIMFGLQLNSLSILLMFSHRYSISKNEESYRDIIEILFYYSQNLDELISDSVIKYLSRYNNYENLLAFILKYKPVVENNICKYCFLTEPLDELGYPCLCKTPCHIKCFLKCENTNSCKICLDPFSRLNEIRFINPINDGDQRIFFPFDDIYYDDLGILKKYHGISRLSMAIVSLQTKRIRELLQEKEILNEIKTLSIEVNYLTTGNLWSNYHSSLNEQAYLDIARELFGTRKFDISEEGKLFQNALKNEFKSMVDLMKSLLN